MISIIGVLSILKTSFYAINWAFDALFLFFGSEFVKNHFRKYFLKNTDKKGKFLMDRSIHRSIACIKEMRKLEQAWKEKQDKIAFSDTITVEELCIMHLRYQVEQNELKPKSIDRRECTIEKHIGEYDLGKMQIQTVKAKDIDLHINRLINEGKLSYSSVEKVLDVLNAAFTWAKLMEKWDANPVEKIKPSLAKKINKMKNKSAIVSIKIKCYNLIKDVKLKKFNSGETFRTKSE